MAQSMVDLATDFLNSGFVDLGVVLDNQACVDLLRQIYQTRKFDPDLFIDEDQHKKNPRWTKNNPGPGINLTEKFDLDFIEKSEPFQNAMTRILGPNYKIMLKKFIVGVPNDWLPKWVHEETKDQMIANLGAYIKPDYQDMTYFRGIDFHQDLIDHKSRTSDFITLYVYLDNVEMDMSPLVVIPKSHIFGATTVPHDLKSLGGNKILYNDRKGKSKEFNSKMLIGAVGSVFFWSQYNLHGTMPTSITNTPRVSLRYLIERGKSTEDCIINKFLKTIDAPLSIKITKEEEVEHGYAEGSKLLKPKEQ